MSTVMFFPSYFIVTMKKAGIDCPEHLESLDIRESAPFDKYPHAHVFLSVHVGSVIDLESLDANAEIIKNIPVERLRDISMKDLLSLGVVMGNPNNLI
jgi:hypothetical protein